MTDNDVLKLFELLDFAKNFRIVEGISDMRGFKFKLYTMSFTVHMENESKFYCSHENPVFTESFVVFDRVVVGEDAYSTFIFNKKDMIDD